MANTVKQGSNNPTNKLTAAVLGVAVVEVARVFTSNFFPEFGDQAMWTALSPVIVFACGWFVPDAPNIMVVVEKHEEEES